MRKLTKYSTIIFLLFFLSYCQKDIITERDYPRIEILNNLEQSENGIICYGNIITLGNNPITEEGFIWDQSNPTIDDSRLIIENPNNKTGKFSTTLKIDFQKGQKYYLKAYVKTDEYTVYSEPLVFTSDFETPAPKIIDITPKQGKYNDIVEIRGEYFSFKPQNTKVYFNGTVAIIISQTDTTIKVRVPELTASNSIAIAVNILGKANSKVGLFSYLY